MMMDISPPLLNSANPWATTLSDLRELWACPHTGAVTTRTALLGGFAHDGQRHRFCLFDAARFGSVSASSDRERVSAAAGESSSSGSSTIESGGMNASLNTLGYSYHTLDEYLGFIADIVTTTEPKPSSSSSSPPLPGSKKSKWFIVSVTGSPSDVAECYRRIARLQDKLSPSSSSARLAMEVNLSCPNIPDKPPPAYSGDALREYISAVAAVTAELEGSPASPPPPPPWGVKTPPYTFAGQFAQLMSALRVGDGNGDAKSPVSFVTATNTLGSCLVLGSPQTSSQTTSSPALPGAGIGGMAGAPLHPLALGNVATLRRLLDEHPSTRHVGVIGIGGVEDAAGYRRMRSVGASAVGVGTALGAKGLAVFEEIRRGLALEEEQQQQGKGGLARGLKGKL
ncbi:uncharacterized protein B0I36DRAFT_322383 [Microdochium trichocladiopsis]|uniref:Dihydroorotate dehydrogenase (fumarate) n=1 Tax=Microdochium trichocladiopsis TaxID=1682393 RepID=A0A9P9BQD7_9PEZI|nr:uncharacterized protein B0I36DRAFT_322383 [Microdochium trichocladiopsis]KAH7030753.1 hypothetical protein B0I36DRAFT_322383 [Microdochium trichocladiopsis]